MHGLSGCKDDDDAAKNPVDQLPPATQEGAFTFGCLVNGEPFVVTNSYKMTAIYQGGVLILGASTEEDNIELGIGMTIRESIEINRQFSLTNSPSSDANFSNTSNFPEQFCIYDEYDTFEGNVIVTYFDSINYIVSGTFSYSTVKSDCDTITITDGRFDLKYIP